MAGLVRASMRQRLLRLVLTPFLRRFHGGLQYQIEHHLFPRLPRANLRRVAPRVRALCQCHGIPYRQLGFLEATAEIVGTLRRVAHAAAAMDRAKGE